MDTLYQWQMKYETYGIEGLKEANSCKGNGGL